MILKFKNWHYHNFLVHYIILKTYAKLFPQYIKKTVVDIGCGTKPYRNFIAPYCDNYIGIDHPGTEHATRQVDIFATAYNTALKAESVSTVFSSAVLEHLEEPDLFFKEANRILKKNGVIILGAPLFWHLHEEPRDFFRYTKHGLKHLFQKNGFQIIEIFPLSGFWVTFMAEFVYYLHQFNRSFVKWIPIIPFISIALQCFALLLNGLDKRFDKWTWAYVGVAKKIPALQNSQPPV